jgi:patatin-like phospholipase
VRLEPFRVGRWLVVLVAAISVFLGCVGRIETSAERTRPPKDIAPFLKYEMHPRGIGADMGPSDARSILVAKRNYEVMEIYRAESVYYPGGRGATASDSRPGGRYPRTCIALSGGGLRAAAYAIGALQGLAEVGAMRNADIISSVSGGSYANYWLATHAVMNDPIEEVLHPGGAMTTRLDNDATIAGRTRFVRSLQGVGAGIVWVIGQFSRPFTVFPMDQFISLGNGSYYSSMLNLAFEPEHYKLIRRKNKRAVTVAALESALNGNSGYPYPIFNAAVRIGWGSACTDDPIAIDQATAIPWREFEFTPHHTGSPILGYRHADPETEDAGGFARPARASD